MRLITKNLIKFVETKGFSDKAFEEEVGWSNGFYGKVKAGRIAFSIEKLRSIVDRFPELNVHWLCTCHGDMIISDAFGQYQDIAKKDQILHSIQAELQLLDSKEHQRAMVALEGILELLKQFNERKKSNSK
jgi:predicted amidohydrolase YtcJ